MADNCLPEDVNGGKSVPKRRAKKPEELKPFGNTIVIDWSDILCEAILRQRGGSFNVAFDWAIGLNDHKWQVFYRGIDSNNPVAEKRL